MWVLHELYVLLFELSSRVFCGQVGEIQSQSDVKQRKPTFLWLKGGDIRCGAKLRASDEVLPQK